MIETNRNFEQSLEYQFLYNDDPNSIFLLLSWLDNKNLADNLVPKYTVTKALLTGLRRSIRNREDKKSIVDGINRLVADDLNRLELAFVIKAYRNAFYNSALIDKLENLALEEFTPHELANATTLFHHRESEKINKIKDMMMDQLHKNKDIAVSEKYSNDFLDKYVKKKIFRVNYYMNKQIVIDYENTGILKLEGSTLTIKELKHIYEKSKFYINRSLKMAYINQYWYSLNDSVLRRYT
ncbi:MAG: hypothetical protein GXY87_03720 [Tissierellia bacterium]|nr:hypothetical protein [Tissierellia bacterium]